MCPLTHCPGASRLVLIVLLSLLVAACATTSGPSLGDSPILRECDAQVRAELHLRDTPVQAHPTHAQAARTARLIGGGAALALETVTGPVLSLLSPVGAAVGLGVNVATIQGGASTAEALEATSEIPATAGTADAPIPFAQAETALRMRYYDLVDACVRSHERSAAAATTTAPALASP